MNYTELTDVLSSIIGEQVPPGSQLTLLGGGALMLLGNPRHTADIDFWGDDVSPIELHRQIIQIAKERKFLIDAVSLERFVPLPEGSDDRKIPIAQFGNLNVYVADPYSIALSKVDQGLDSDYVDIEFLLHTNHIELKKFEAFVQEAVAKAGKFDLHPDILSHFQELQNRLK